MNLNGEFKCRFPNCWKDLSQMEFFCSEHSNYDALKDILFTHDLNDETLTSVYVIGCRRTNAVKIGMAYDVMDRIAQLQTGYPFPLKLYSASYTRRRWAEKIERACHAKLKEFGLHLQGEWFEIEPDDGVRLVGKIAASLKYPTLTAADYHAMLALWDDVPCRGTDDLMPVLRKIKADWAAELVDIAKEKSETHI